jgi:hypothetical protein
MTAVWLALAMAVAMPLQTRAPRDTPAVRPVGTAMIAGIVSTADESPRPVRRALVTLSGGGLSTTVQTVTDDSGRFVFTELAAGRYTLTADKPAWIRTYYGSKRVGRGPASTIALADGQRLTNIGIGLLRGGAIEGTVVDELGKPLASSQVTVQQILTVNGERKLVAAQGAQPWATTDDRGRYRLFGLPPGAYAVRASGSGVTPGARLTMAADVAAALKGDKLSAGPAISRRHAYFPGVPDAASAEVITLAAAAERMGVDIVVPLARSSRIDGMAITAGGQPLRNVMVGIANVSTGSMWSSPGAVRPGADGKFSLPSIAPGRYLFFGSGTDRDNVPDGPGAWLTLWTATEVVVGEGETVDAVLHFLPGVTVSGRVSIASAGELPDISRFRLTLSALPAISGAAVGLPAVTPQADGTFAIKGVPPGKYRLVLAPQGAWSLRSAIVQGRDTLDLPLEVQPGRDVDNVAVTLTDQPTEISGTLFDQLDRPAPEYAIVAFSTDRAHWTMAPRRISGVVKVGSDGTFVVRGLPPGEYFLTALVDLDPSQLADSAFLEYLATASIRVTVGEGERKVQDLKLPGQP